MRYMQSWADLYPQSELTLVGVHSPSETTGATPSTILTHVTQRHHVSRERNYNIQHQCRSGPKRFRSPLCSLTKSYDHYLLPIYVRSSGYGAVSKQGNLDRLLQDARGRGDL